MIKVVVDRMWSCSLGKSMNLSCTVRGNKTSRKFGMWCVF